MQVKHRYHAVLNIFFSISLKKTVLFSEKASDLARNRVKYRRNKVELVIQPADVEPEEREILEMIDAQRPVEWKDVFFPTFQPSILPI